MKSIVISFNQTHFRVYCIKKSLLNYERLGISITLKRTDNTISPPRTSKTREAGKSREQEKLRRNEILLLLILLTVHYLSITYERTIV